MARMARVVVPYYPHHVTQRGNRRQQTFFSEEDHKVYLELLAKAKDMSDVEVLAYCLMPNHVHLVVVPRRDDSLASFFSEAHRRYTRRINFREGWRGHLWQERFHSFVMDEQYLLATVRYIELNPVRARLCDRPEEWTWSSVHAHLAGKDDMLVSVKPMLERINNWQNFLATYESSEELTTIRRHSRTGRPAGNEGFLDKLEAMTGRSFRRAKTGPKPKIIK
ncbi:MAG: transposase [Gammaproteobacteria bacterium]|jgi:putative transposase|nr:transposase [Gammaproteobacteria bacterium]